MSQLQKRCFFASMSAHGLLLLVVALGSAFFLPKTRPISQDTLRVIPSKLVDEAISGGGGNPEIPVTPEPQVQKGETVRLADPPKPAPVQPPKPKPEKKPDVKPEPKPEKPKEKEPPKEQRRVSLADLKPVKDKPKEPAPSAVSKSSDLAKELAKIRQDLRDGFKNGTVVETPGGGEAYADYAAFVKAIYDNNWILTENMPDNGAAAKVEVVIDRDGDVRSARIIRPSGNPALDRSVQEVLNKVKYIAPFPQGAREKTRSFIINFNLRNKLGSG